MRIMNDRVAEFSVLPTAILHIYIYIYIYTHSGPTPVAEIPVILLKQVY